MTMTLSGPVGDLEATYHNPPAAKSAALLCHPHPSYGGSMHDGVLGLVADVLSNDDSTTPVAHLRFNFRGVGRSAGNFDNGQGEQDDLLAAWHWLEQQSDWEHLYLVGYSFGAAMAWAAGERCANLSKLILLAPPTAAMDFATEINAGVSTQVIVGTADDYCDTQHLPAGATTIMLDGGDHFFSTTAPDLARAIRNAL